MSPEQKHLREVFRCVKIKYRDDGMPSKLEAVEAFTSFIEVENSFVMELHKLITKLFQQKGLTQRSGVDKGITTHPSI